ncbi:hypothetical protein N0V90_009460 [Kalmusia sp. IMI 367209]|nr:hypothetical protein N0V90_009460 [Kalmusia sp. IMI 367209]
MPVPHLPVEIHTIISSHVARKDLPSYRSASKTFADIGARFLFRDLVLHASYDSLNRIKNVGCHNELRDTVHTVEWDTSTLNLDAWDFNDWKNRIRGLRRHELAALQQTWQTELLDQNTIREHMHRFLLKEYQRYESLLAEEQEVQFRHLWNLEDHLARFPRLKNIVVSKRQHASLDADFDRKGPRFTELVKRGMLGQHCRAPYKHNEDMFPLVVALGVAQSSTHQIEAKNLNFGVFSQGAYTEHLQNIDVSHITRLNLRFSMTSPSSDPLESSMSIMNCKRVLQQGNLKDFLQKFKTLQALSLDFDVRSHGNGRAPVNLQDVFSIDHVWPQLRELAIYHVDTSASTFTHLISAHSATLKDLALGDLCLDPPGSWEALLTNIQPELALDSATFEYFLFDARIENFLRGRSAMIGWYCDSQECVEETSDLGERLERYMVEGGHCPLREQRKIARVVGRLETQRVDDWVHNRHVSLLT